MQINQGSTRLCLLMAAATSAVALALALFPSLLNAASVCRWIDENGRTQISDTVPDRFKLVAVCINSRLYELSAEQQREAAERSKVRSAQANAPVPAASSAAGAENAALAPPQPVIKRPVQTITDATDCPTAWRIFEESSECFGSYRTVQGGIKPEAFDFCREVASPDLKCGPRTR